MTTQPHEEILSRLGHFGRVHPRDRTPEQQVAHDAALARRPKFLLPVPDVPVGTKVMLTDLWKDAEVVADLGREFTGFHQVTGSCVGCSTGNAVATLSFLQRKLASQATKAFVPFWPEMYGLCRRREGDHGRGEGAIDSIMFDVLCEQGVLDSKEAADLPAFGTGDGYSLPVSTELDWSDPRGPSLKYADASKKYPLGSASTLSSADDVIAAVLNGYPVLDGCWDFVSKGVVGPEGVCLGTYDHKGGHSTCYLGAWLHPTLGWLCLYSNQWAGNLYPDDGSGKGRCCCWVRKAEVQRLFTELGGTGETAALSHLTYLPVQHSQVAEVFTSNSTDVVV